MNILIYIPTVNQKNGGVRQYSISLLKILSHDEDNKYYILHNSQDPVIEATISDAKNLFLIPAKIGRESKINKARRLISTGINFLLYKKYGKVHKDPFSFLDAVCKLYNTTIAYSPYQNCPPTTWAKTVCTMHDVQELIFPEYFTPEERADRAVGYNAVMKKADKIVVSYNHIKEDIGRFFPNYIHKVSVCLLDMNYIWLKNYQKTEVSENLKNILPVNYLLYPANTWQHKNHITLLKSLAFIRDEKKILINLVCTGNTNEHYEKNIIPLLKELNLTTQVVFTGIVEEQDLFNIYQNAKAVVIPTKYEAGSYPLMESMILEIPVICSNVTSLPDTIKNPAFTFDPDDIYDIASKCISIYQDESFRKSNKNNSHKNASYFLKTGALDIIKRMFIDLNNDKTYP